MIATLHESNKTLTFDQASDFFSQMRSRGLRIVQCHGTFDLLHPGHIVHLEEAKTHGDILVLTLTAEAHVNKGPGRPYFNDELRVKSLAALECVDYVVLIPFAAAVEAIEAVRPHVYCKGTEYSIPENDVTGNINDDIVTVNKLGGEVKYVGSVVFSSSKLINNNLGVISPKVQGYCRELAARYTPGQFRDAVERFAGLKVLLIGDTIFDRYSYVNVQGLTTKNRTLSSHFLNEDTQCGGALAVYLHLKAFCRKVNFISLIGDEPWAQALIQQHVDPEDDAIVRDPKFTTIIKQRFVETSIRNTELQKLFAINYLDEAPPESATQQRLLEVIEKHIQNYDMVLVTDFGHGIMQPPIRSLVQEQSPYLGLNCQTNSNNHGFNIINRQYYRADCFSIDEQEMLLACGHRDPDFESELTILKHTFNAHYCWLTRGAKYTLGMSHEDATASPSLEHEIVDTIGAGDALFSVATLAAFSELPIDLATFMGQLAGAQAVKIPGNSQPIDKTKLIRGGMSLLNF